MFLHYENKITGDIFEEKGIREQFLRIKNPTMIQLSRIQLSSKNQIIFKLLKS